MKKSQRLRFYALVDKQSKGTLNDAESVELKQLAALVSLHPNAAEDTEDETDDEKKKREEKEASDKKAEDDKKKDDEEDKKDEDAKAKAAAKPGVSARLAAAMAGLKGGTPAQAAADLKAEQTAHAKTKADLTAANSQLSALNAQLSAANAALSALCDFLGLKPAEVSGKTQADIDALCTAKINAAAIEQVASIGFASAKLPTPTENEGAAATKAELHKQYNAISDPNERAAFYAKHKDKLLG